MKIFRNTGCYIQSQRYIVGDEVDDKLENGEVIKKIAVVTANFIPMRDVLRKFFNLPGVFKAVFKYYHKLFTNVDVIQNFVQGNLWRKKVKNNPLGSHKTIHKLGLVYYSIPCLPPEVNSLIENIFVGGFFHSQDRYQFENHIIFQIFIEELNYLETECIDIETEKGKQKIYFALGLLLGDNLGLKSILGFIESFNATYYCRFCKNSKTEIQCKFREKNEIGNIRGRFSTQ